MEVAPDAKPPVCRVLDYSKYKYEQTQKQKAARKHQQQINIREIKFRPKIAQHDYDTKKGHVERFLKARDKVKVTIMFRGREMAHPERGEMILNRLAEELERARDRRAAAPAGRPQHDDDARAAARGHRGEVVPLDATLLLCDHAEAVGGKLYINGGGWNVLLRPGVPVNVSLAILIEVPWDQAGTQHRLRAYLLTEDGERSPARRASRSCVDGGSRSGARPASSPARRSTRRSRSTSTRSSLDAGGYEWRLEVDGALVARKPFRVASGAP